jgi:two-component sensor histidine kinase
MSSSQAGTLSWTRRLGFRIAFLLAAVLLPLAVLSAARSADLLAEARDRSEAALLGETAIAAWDQWRVIREAAGVTSTLALIAARTSDDRGTCERLLDAVSDEMPLVATASLVLEDGRLGCSTTDPPGGDPGDTVGGLSDQPRHRELASATGPRILVAPSGGGQGLSMVLTAPVTLDGKGGGGEDSGGGGYVALSIPFSRLAERQAGSTTRPLVLFSAQGEVLLGGDGEMQPPLPADRSLAALAGPAPLSFTARDGAGVERIFAVVPLVAGQVYALGSRPARADAAFGTPLASLPVVAPAVMWAASLAVAVIAVHRLVIRHVGELSRWIRAFAGGARAEPNADLRDAPLELAEIGEALGRMMDGVRRDEAELEDMVRQREVLLREVHHRVRNNLQLVASILNMQVRRTDSPAFAQTLTMVQDTVLGLAGVHRALLESAGFADLPAEDLLAEIVMRLQGRLDDAGNAHAIAREVDSLRLSHDQAVPVALLVTHGLDAAMSRSAGLDHRTRRIVLRLRRVGATCALLEIESDVDMTPDMFGQTVLPDVFEERLMTGFAQQLGATLERRMAEGRETVTVRFALSQPPESAPMPAPRPRSRDPRPATSRRQGNIGGERALIRHTRRTKGDRQ